MHGTGREVCRIAVPEPLHAVQVPDDPLVGPLDRVVVPLCRVNALDGVRLPVLAGVVLEELHLRRVPCALGVVDLTATGPHGGVGPQDEHRVVFRVPVVHLHPGLPPSVLATVEVGRHAAGRSVRSSGDRHLAPVHGYLLR